MELEFFWACSGFPGILKQYCHKSTLILSIKAQKSLDAPAKLPIGIETHPPWPHQPCLPAVKMQSLSLADEHPQGTTRTIFSKTSIRRLCSLQVWFYHTAFNFQMVKTLGGVLQAYYQNLKSQRNFTYDLRKGSLYVLKASACIFSVLCPQAAKTLLSQNTKTKDVAYRRGRTLSFQRRKC